VVVADEVARETLSAAGEVYDVFELELLDNFEQPNKPIDSNNRLIILMGVMFGLIAGIATVFAIEFINIQLLGNQSSQFIDRRTGKYTRAYFDHRLTQEINDSNRSKYFYSLALIRLLGQDDVDVDHLDKRSTQDFDNIYKLLRSSFRDHDVIAQYDPNTIGLIIPDLIGVEIKERLKLIIGKSNSGSENGNGGFSQNGIAIGIVSVEDHTKDEDELIRLLSQAVFLASEKENDGIFLRTVKQRNQAEFEGEKEEV
jgi:GGDEF domain-containing protein